MQTGYLRLWVRNVGDKLSAQIWEWRGPALGGVRRLMQCRVHNRSSESQTASYSTPTASESQDGPAEGGQRRTIEGRDM